MVEGHKFVLTVTCPNKPKAEATEVEVLVHNPDYLHP